MKYGMVLSLVFCSALAGTAAGSVRAGDTELGFMGGLLSENAGGSRGVDFQSWAVSGNVGYFYSDNVELSLIGTFKNSSETWDHPAAPGSALSKIDRDSHVYGLGGQGRYFFNPESAILPYLGGQALWADAKVSEKYRYSGSGAELLNWDWDRSGQGVLWGPLAGIRFDLNEQNALFIEYQYHIWSGGISDLMDDGHAILIGLVHRIN
jgi:hypothetical protein